MISLSSVKTEMNQEIKKQGGCQAISINSFFLIDEIVILDIWQVIPTLLHSLCRSLNKLPTYLKDQSYKHVGQERLDGWLGFEWKKSQHPPSYFKSCCVNVTSGKNINHNPANEVPLFVLPGFCWSLDFHFFIFDWFSFMREKLNLNLFDTNWSVVN